MQLDKSTLQIKFKENELLKGFHNPLQCPCRENPREGGAWWAAISGVAQSWTRLKRLSSSSSSKGLNRKVRPKKNRSPRT